MRIIGSLAGIIVGIMIVWKTFPLVNTFGQISWAEQHLGGGGTYTLYKLIGLIVIILSAMHLFGLSDILVYPFRSIFGSLAPN